MKIPHKTVQSFIPYLCLLEEKNMAVTDGVMP
jgi:hypothetical protein